MRHLTLAVIAVLLLGACGAAIQPSPARAVGIASREFWSTAVVGHDLVADTRVRITFNQDGTIGAGAGCNSMGGTWSIDATTLTIRIGQMTEMGCPDDLFAQDDWLVAFLGSGLTATVDGDELTLTGAGVTMTLVDRKVADPDLPLEGTTWILDGLEIGSGDTGTVSSVPEGVQPTVKLEGGRLSVDTGCNTGGATATVDGSTLTIGPLGLTKRGCEGAAADVERLVTSVLHGAVTVDIDGQALRLTGPAGGLMFRAG